MDEVLKIKISFESYMKLGILIMYYHADNGRFADNSFLNDLKSMQQTITYRGWIHIIKKGWEENRRKYLPKNVES